MATLTQITLVNTFDEWRVRTNDIISKTNLLDSGAIVSNSSVITVSGNPRLGNTVYLTSNAFANTGGTITGNTTFTANVTITGGVLDLLS